MSSQEFCSQSITTGDTHLINNQTIHIPQYDSYIRQKNHTRLILHIWMQEDRAKIHLHPVAFHGSRSQFFSIEAQGLLGR